MAPSTTGRNRKAQSRKTAARPAAGKKKAATRKSTSAKPKSGAKRTTDVNKKRSSPPDIELDGDVLEFIEALDRFKKTHNKPFPSWSEVLHVLRGLGYRKVS